LKVDYGGKVPDSLLRATKMKRWEGIEDDRRSMKRTCGLDLLFVVRSFLRFLASTKRTTKKSRVFLGRFDREGMRRWR